MVRKELKQLGNDKRFTFRGTFAKIGYKKSYHGSSYERYLPTILFSSVTCDGKVVTDHLWINYGKQFSSLGELKKGEIVQFDARVDQYIKGYFNGPQLVDYGIERPTKVSIVKSLVFDRHELPELPDNKNALIGYIMKINKDFYQANNRPYDEWYVDQYNEWLKK